MNVACLPTFLPTPHGDGVFRLHPHRQQQLPGGAEAEVAHGSGVRTAQHRQRLLAHGVPDMDGRCGACGEVTEGDERGGRRSDLGALHREEDAENHQHQQGAVVVTVLLSLQGECVSGSQDGPGGGASVLFTWKVTEVT